MLHSNDHDHDHPRLRWECSGNCCDRELLAEPLKFPTASTLTAANRFMKAAMSEQLCDFDAKNPKKSGIPSKALIELYHKFAQGGAGILVTGSIMVNPTEIEAPGNAIIHKSVDTIERTTAFEEWAKAGKANGTILIAQLLHPGIHASPCTGASRFDPGRVTKEQLECLFEEFIYGGLYAEGCGFDGVEIPCAYEYTLGYLSSASMNQRTDGYSGSFDNRVRALFKIIDGIRKHAVNNTRFIVGVKLDAMNLAPGFSDSEFAAFVKKLEDHGVDYISFGGGSWDLIQDMNEERRQTLDAVEATYCTVATTMKKYVRKARIFLNGGPTLCDMSEVLRQGWASGVAIGRSMAQEPAFARKMLCGSITGSAKSLVDPADFVTGIQIAGTQMWQHATNNPVMDPSNPEHLAKFKLCQIKHEEAIRRAPADQPVTGYAKLQL